MRFLLKFFRQKNVTQFVNIKLWTPSHKQNENIHFISYCRWYLMHWLIILWSSEVKRRWRQRTWTRWAYRKYLTRLIWVMECRGFHAEDLRNTSLPNILSWLKYISEIVKNYLKKKKASNNIFHHYCQHLRAPLKERIVCQGDVVILCIMFSRKHICLKR